MNLEDMSVSIILQKFIFFFCLIMRKEMKTYFTNPLQFPSSIVSFQVLIFLSLFHLPQWETET